MVRGGKALIITCFRPLTSLFPNYTVNKKAFLFKAKEDPCKSPESIGFGLSFNVSLSIPKAKFRVYLPGISLGFFQSQDHSDLAH